MNGYQYLHGSNRNVGDFQLRGVMFRSETGAVKFIYNAQWNDIIDPNYTYESDRRKNEIAKIISFGRAKDYIIRIKWNDSMTLTPDGRDVSHLEQRVDLSNERPNRIE